MGDHEIKCCWRIVRTEKILSVRTYNLLCQHEDHIINWLKNGERDCQLRNGGKAYKFVTWKTSRFHPLISMKQISCDEFVKSKEKVISKSSI